MREDWEYDTLHGENPKRVRDAVIALTSAAAAEEVEPFVTEDGGLARRVKAKAKTLKVWNFSLSFSSECPRTN